jgi:hypothetical protein
VLYSNFINRRNSSCQIAKEKLLTNQIVFYFRKNHFLAEKFSKKLVHWFEAGLMKKVISKFIDFEAQKNRKSKNLKVLSLDQLYGIFGVWAFGLLIAILTFFKEILIGKWKNKMMKK